MGSFHFDDYSVLSGNIWRVMGTRPLTGLTFWLSLTAGDRNPLDYHAINLALHLVAALLLFDALQQLVSARAAFIGAIVFAVHPIQTEAVNYVFARATELDTVLCLAALLAWLRGRQWWAVAWFAAALMAKEECAAFPVFLFLLGRSLGKLKGRVPALLVMAAIAVAAGVGVYVGVLRNPGVPAGPHAGITPLDYFLAQGPVILRYLRLIVVPWGFNVDTQIAVTPPWLGLAAWALIGAMVVVASRWFFGVRAGFWFIAGLVLLLPSSSIFPVEDLAAERRMYLPMIAFAACAGVLLERVKPAVVAAVAVVLIGLSVERTLVWRTEQSLWSDALEKSPEKVRPKIQLARVSDPPRALALLQQAESQAPDDPRIPTEMGRIYLANGNAAQSLSEFGRALALSPRSADALNNRGAALLALGQADAARQDFERALAINPCQPNARENLAHMGIERPAARGCE
ncbi:MAG: tetratricopeptide repeat protein [Bryobacteraceae bacterium]